MSSVREKLDEGDGINGQVTTAFSDIRNINKLVEEHNTSIDEKIDHLAELFSKIEKSASDTYQLVNDNEKYSEDISASVEEQVASFSEIKSSVEHLTEMSRLSKESVDQFNL
jgi:methyl-accepting chemotaxis protein